MFCSALKPYFLFLANLQSNKRQNKETLRYSHRFFAYMHLSKRETIFWMVFRRDETMDYKGESKVVL